MGLQRDHLNLIFIQFAMDFCDSQYLFDLSLVCVLFAFKKQATVSEEILWREWEIASPLEEQLRLLRTEASRAEERTWQTNGERQAQQELAPAVGPWEGWLSKHQAQGWWEESRRAAAQAWAEELVYKLFYFYSVLANLEFPSLKRLSILISILTRLGFCGFVLFWLVWVTW